MGNRSGEWSEYLRDGGGRDSKIAVIDIGSNSVRLVIYDSLKRTPIPIYNEKSFCSLGKGMSRTQRLHPEGVKKARQAIARMLSMVRVNHAAELHIIATAAIRDADDGKAFVKELERAHEIKIKILSGKKEAQYAALGIVAGHDNPRGLVADLGGGSLELTAINGADIIAHDTQPLGALRLLDRAGDKPELLEDLINRYLDEVEWLQNQPEKADFSTLYAVGGSFRALAKIHMTEQHYPLPMIHHYQLETAELLPFLQRLALYSAERCTALPITERRQEQIPVVASLLVNLIERAGIQRMIFSTNGIREGLLFNHISPYIRREDPLLTSCERLRGSLHARSGYVQELFDWMSPIFAGESREKQRLRAGACMLSNMALAVQRPYRALSIYEHILHYSLQGINHPQRVALAASLYHRYQANWKDDENAPSYQLLNDEWRHWAKLLGALLRLGYSLSGGMAGNLSHTQLRLDKDRPKLRLGAPMKALQGETLDKRLGAVSDAYIEMMRGSAANNKN